MEIEYYRVLLSVLEKRSFSETALELGYTTSGISRIISALEKDCGYKLFHRKATGIEPTPECLQAIPLVRKLVEADDECEKEFAKIRGLEKGTVMVGNAYSAYYDLLAEIIVAFHAEYPDIQVSVTRGCSSDLLKEMQQRRIDICIISRRNSVEKWHLVCKDHMTVWLSDHHPLAGLAAFPLRQLENESLIDQLHEVETDHLRMLERHDIKPHVQFTTGDSAATMALVKAGLGVGINNAINSPDQADGIRILPIEPLQEVDIGIATTNDVMPAARCFYQYLCRKFDENITR